jgi:pyridoxine/pyridoxamine 5'-phosphate oxidase
MALRPRARATCSGPSGCSRTGCRYSTRTRCRALARVSADPGLVAPDWTLYTLTADEAEFWQGDLDRRHVRLRYRRAGSTWTRQLLWP